jgi:hypothetical protein
MYSVVNYENNELNLYLLLVIFIHEYFAESFQAG